MQFAAPTEQLPRRISINQLFTLFFFRSSSSSSSGSSSGTACNQSGSGLCIQKGYTSSLCTEGGGTPVSTCPTTGLAGCCTISGIEECEYSPATASDEMAGCTQAGGTFSTTP